MGELRLSQGRAISAFVCMNETAAVVNAALMRKEYFTFFNGFDAAAIMAHFSSRAMRLEVSQRLPPIFWTSE